jgi:hypothetical protein
MNARALIKIDPRTSWMERLLGARGARLLLSAGGTIAVVLTVPPPLLERLMTSSGLASHVALLAPPIGLGTRIALAGLLALLVVGLVWAIWGELAEPEAAQGDAAEDAPDGEPQDEMGEDEMIHARRAPAASGWGTIVRLVRGGFHDNDEARGSVPVLRRRDRHPDAPARSPLFASRDLPAPDATAPSEDMAAPLGEAVTPPVPATINVPAEPTARDEALADGGAPEAPAALTHAAPAPFIAPVAPPPRSPEPMSEAEIAREMADLPPRRATMAPRMAAGASPAMAMVQDLALPLLPDADIAMLAARFETGLAKRAAIINAEEARQALDARIALVQPDPSVRAALRAHRPIELVAQAGLQAQDDGRAEPEGAAFRLDQEVEEALNRALATLRKLTEQGRR